MQRKSSNNFSKFTGKKRNAAIKEQFKKEKREWKKEREEFFEKKRSEGRGHRTEVDSRGSKVHSQQSASGIQHPASSIQQMPLNKFIAHAGICARREAAEMVKKGLVKVNNQLVTEPGFKVSAKDDIKV